MLFRCVALVGVLALSACAGDNFQSNDGRTVDAGYDGDGAPPPPPPGECKAGQDSDNDGIDDAVEGCGPPAVDTDADGVPDYLDTDSDNDGVPDRIEGSGDTDNDGVPDFQDTDSDDDGVKDGDEDLNGDGKLGCCLSTCGEKRDGCPTVAADACGPGQTCQNGSCSPAVDFLCSNGETDPHKDKTYGGAGDATLPTFVCHRPPEDQPDKGLKPMDFHRSKPGDFHVALERATPYGPATIKDATALEDGAAFDYSQPDQQVAGLVLSMKAPGADLKTSFDAIVATLTKIPGASSVQLSSGTPSTSHDGYPTVLGLQLAVALGSAQNPPALRNALFSLLLGNRPVAQLPPASWGQAVTSYLLRLQILLRPDGRVVLMGGVAPRTLADDTSKQTGFLLDDISNGTGLATAADTDTVECDPFVLERNPTADIIWVVDDSQSMDDNRQDMVNNAADFFARAVKSGLDFRMAITGVKDPSEAGVVVGKLCSRKSSNADDDGGTDRFLTSSEQDIFKSCIQNPPYSEFSAEHSIAHAYEAVVRALPRAANDPAKVRTEAQLVVIFATDEVSQELKSGSSYKGKSGMLSSSDYGDSIISQGKCTLSSSTQQKLDAYLKPWIDLFTGKDPTYGAGGKAIVHLIGGLCSSACGGNIFNPKPEIGHGFFELVNATGGITADVCQQNLGTTLQIIIDNITGAASPAVLQYVPISSSLAVAIGNQKLARSRVQGFDYAASSNSLVFIGVPIQKGTQVIAS
ncbi:MAG: hypothetical protein KC503_22415, partial [Myxococcales bacterium]|nr:hypothetical protein [Myxococcales bacterium]